MRMRTIDQAAIYLKEKDPQTAVTKHALRQIGKKRNPPQCTSRTQAIDCAGKSRYLLFRRCTQCLKNMLAYMPHPYKN